MALPNPVQSTAAGSTDAADSSSGLNAILSSVPASGAAASKSNQDQVLSSVSPAIKDTTPNSAATAQAETVSVQSPVLQAVMSAVAEAMPGAAKGAATNVVETAKPSNTANAGQTPLPKVAANVADCGCEHSSDSGCKRRIERAAEHSGECGDSRCGAYSPERARLGQCSTGFEHSIRGSVQRAAGFIRSINNCNKPVRSRSCCRTD
jgi:hypothetical protein